MPWLPIKDILDNFLYSILSLVWLIFCNINFPCQYEPVFWEIRKFNCFHSLTGKFYALVLVLLAQWWSYNLTSKSNSVIENRHINYLMNQFVLLYRVYSQICTHNLVTWEGGKFCILVLGPDIWFYFPTMHSA